MIPFIHNKLNAYQSQLYQWATERELAHPLSPEIAPENEDYSLPTSETTLRERVVFKICTGLDLQMVRDFKRAYSPRFSQLNKIVLSDDKSRGRANAASELVRIQVGFRDQTVESYWVDREFSVDIKDLAILEETLKNHKIMWCQRRASDARDTEWYCVRHYPIESQFSFNVRDRLGRPDKRRDYISQYDEATDTFRLVPHQESVYRDYVSVPAAMRVVANWVNVSLTKRLAQDKARREEDPNCKLLFAHNEIYEKWLEERKHKQMIINACAVAGFVFISLAGVVFFCQQAKRSDLD